MGIEDWPNISEQPKTCAVNNDASAEWHQKQQQIIVDMHYSVYRRLNLGETFRLNTSHTWANRRRFWYNVEARSAFYGKWPWDNPGRNPAHASDGHGAAVPEDNPETSLSTGYLESTNAATVSFEVL